MGFSLPTFNKNSVGVPLDRQNTFSWTFSLSNKQTEKKSMFSSVIDIFIFNICSFHFRIRRCLGAMRAVQVLETGSLYLAILVLVIVIEEVLSLMMVMYRCIPRADVKGPMLLTLPGKCGLVLWYSSGKESRINNLSFIVKSTNAAPSWIKGSSSFKLLT